MSGERGDQAGESEEQGGRGRGHHRGGHEGRARRGSKEDHHLAGTDMIWIYVNVPET